MEKLLIGSSGLSDYTLVTSIKKTWDQPIDREGLYTLLKSVLIDTMIQPHSWEGATDYALLGLIIEQVSGETYADFMRKNIIEPLGLVNTGFVEGVGETDNLAVFYQGKDDEPVAESIDMSNLVGYGSAYSSAEDLYHLIRTVRNGDLLSAENTAKMFLADNDYGVGYGWQVIYIDGKTWITNDVGFNYGAYKRAVLAWAEDGSMVIVGLTNQQDVNMIIHPQHIVCLPNVDGFPTLRRWIYDSFCD